MFLLRSAVNLNLLLWFCYFKKITPKEVAQHDIFLVIWIDHKILRVVCFFFMWEHLKQTKIPILTVP